jgi:hypothetical protein
MKPLCRELERHLESGAERLPDALGAHLTGCAKCQRAWRLHQAYQSALHAARREPMPACELPWSRIQAQLAARAVSRRPFGWLRPALAWGTAVAVVLAVGAALFPFGAQPPSQGVSLVRTPAYVQPESGPAHNAPADTGTLVAAERTPPSMRVVAQATPRLRELTRPEPPALESPNTNAPAPRRRVTDRATLPSSDGATRMPTSRPNFEQSVAVASLPLTPFGVSDQAAGVEYLPISYGSPSSHHEVSNNEAVIGSF